MRGVQRMIEDGRQCEDIVTQLMAARAALDRASLVIMTRYIQRCLMDPTGQASQAGLERVMSFFLQIAGAPPGEENPLDET